MVRKTKEIKEDESPKKKPGLKIVYVKDATKEQYEVADDQPESRAGALPVAPSNYAPGSANHKITAEDIAKYPKLKGVALSGDIVDKDEFEKFVE